MSNRSKHFLTILLALVFVLCPVAPFKAQAVAFRAVAASREPVRAPRGMVATTNRIASEIGVEILRRGGNAVDATIAVAFALAVVFPVDGNLGGGGFMLIRLRDGRSVAIDYRETAPLAATRDLYLDPSGNLIRGEGSSTVGYRAVGVPGTVAGMALALKRYGSGRLTWAQLVEPARRLASKGFPVSHLLERSLRTSTKLGLYPESRRIFQNNGKFYAEGETLRQPELAATLRRIGRRGPREFYEGRTARLIASDMKRMGGLISLEDLRRYSAKERTPLRGTYRGFEVISMPPPSSGGAVLIEMLNMLEGYDVGGTGWNSSASLHLLTEVMRRAFADRAEYMGDTDFVRVPIAGLIEKSYAARLRTTINMERASKSTEIRAGQPTAAEGSETTHFTVVDAAGNAVANTYTLNDDYGAGVTARGTGVLLNNEMDDFTSKAGVPNEFGLIQSERNSIAPGKRPLSAMTPTFVLRKDGTLWFALGSPGGPRIINAVLQVIVNIVDYGMDLQQAIDAPRIHHQWLPDELFYEPYGLSADTARALAALGHRLTLRPEYKGPTRQAFMGDVQGVMIEEKTGVRLGATDPRRSDGPPAGY
ncbi:MAG TPA: gamma-glutamyltransferase [Pyrinomonadaceae bacterium]|jgi:gamma-glutamyltranspeptidase/glutathione hydrolase|nr:gamma-glutamyltransferase [Pyrinomonadaceae bacterium]